jgi:hypothetical protein
MKHAAFLISVEDSSRAGACTWQIARAMGTEVELCQPVTVEPEDMPAAINTLSDQLHKLGYTGDGVCLGLASSMVFAASIDTQNILGARKNRRKGMLYKLEEQLPIEAEKLTADYLPLVGGMALAVSVENTKVQAIIDQLAQGRVEVASICPTAILALRGQSSATPVDYVVLCGTSGLDLFRMIDGVPVAWYLAGCVEELARRLEVDLLCRPVESPGIVLRMIGPRPEGISALREKEPSLRIEDANEEPVVKQAARGAQRLLKGDAEGWGELRRDGLAMPDAWKRLSRPLAFAACALILLLAATSTALLWRAARYGNLTDQSLDAQAKLYRKLYPNTAVPAGVASRFLSEYKRLAGVSGESMELPDQPGVLEALRRLIGNLPPAVRLRITDVRISPSGIVVEGQARSHSDAEAVVGALAKGGLAFEPPRSEAVTRGDRNLVSFTLTGKLAPAKSATQVVSGANQDQRP